MRSDTAARSLFVALLVLTLYVMYLIFKPLLPGIAWAIVLAVAFWPVHARLTRWLRGWEWTASVLLSVLVAAFIVVPAAIAVIKLAGALMGAYEWLNVQVAAEGSRSTLLEEVPWLRQAADWLGQYVDLEAIDLRKMALSALGSVGGALAAHTKGLVANALETVVTVAVMLVTMAVLFHEGPALAALVRQFLPLAEDEKEEVFRQLRGVTRAVFYGVLLTALVQAAVGAAGIAIVGLPYVVAFGAAMFFAAVLPAGTAIVWGPAAVWLLLSGHPWKALFLALWGALAVGTIDNLLRPYFIGKGVQMSSLMVFFGIFGGMLAFGLVGLFLGPLVITLFLFLLEVAKRDWFRNGAAG